jgi:hypothetical protein
MSALPVFGSLGESADFPPGDSYEMRAKTKRAEATNRYIEAVLAHTELTRRLGELTTQLNQAELERNSAIAGCLAWCERLPEVPDEPNYDEVVVPLHQDQPFIARFET